VKTKTGRSLVAISIAVMSAVVALGVTTAVAAETSPKTSTVFHACLKNGTLSKVSAKTVTCGSGYMTVRWNQTGPTGPKGATGAQGPMGPSNSFYDSDDTPQQVQSTLSPILSTSDLAVGTYVVNADVWLDDESPSNASDLAICELTLGTATDEVEVGLLGPTSAPQKEGTLTMTVAATITSAGPATVSCVGTGNTGETLTDTVNITAIQSASLSS
jgi:hypothetical protein